MTPNWEFREPYPEEVYIEVNQWCIDNLGYHARTAYHVFEFEKETDLNWFILRWSQANYCMSKKNRIIEIQDITNKISPTFCLAKWHHTTIYLQTGETHSCYHPAPHHIPLEEIGDNPGALHNTLEKKTQRLAMLEGEKPGGCQYCWNIEAMGPDYISDRHERNEGIYTPERVEEITTNDWMHNINPEYVEISFGNECNFKCGYCHPKASSSFYKEVKNYGPYDMVMNHRIDITHLKLFEEETNPYVKAWWDWWPTMRKDLSILRVTGGEPLLQQSTWKLLDDLEANPLPRLELNVNTNLGIKPILVTRLAKKIINLQRHRGIKNFNASLMILVCLLFYF